ncbi:uncharacterized protein N7511_004314 [Penicillium nucicola]|uniref:uncharacterized protein n=1 Tax=Penicillium nucicola TaxID=1850975 RepID=UPI002545B263|nr:uncharacterized protein N7511_004314 [Penicillium nucicola]KAJ5766698.1 hypothetical protein N7511_004314 [Penicillium nucicola]
METPAYPSSAHFAASFAMVGGHPPIISITQYIPQLPLEKGSAREGELAVRRRKPGSKSPMAPSR